MPSAILPNRILNQTIAGVTDILGAVTVERGYGSRSSGGGA